MLFGRLIGTRSKAPETIPFDGRTEIRRGRKRNRVPCLLQCLGERHERVPVPKQRVRGEQYLHRVLKGFPAINPPGAASPPALSKSMRGLARERTGRRMARS